jgi:hypothetical protein
LFSFSLALSSAQTTLAKPTQGWFGHPRPVLEVSQSPPLPKWGHLGSPFLSKGVALQSLTIFFFFIKPLNKKNKNKTCGSHVSVDVVTYVAFGHVSQFEVCYVSLTWTVVSFWMDVLFSSFFIVQVPAVINNKAHWTKKKLKKKNHIRQKGV